MVGRAPSASLFPYTTLFRSEFPSAELSVQLVAFAVVSVTVDVFPVATEDGEAVIDPVAPGRTVMTAITASPSSVATGNRSEEHTSELQSRFEIVCRLLLEKK